MTCATIQAPMQLNHLSLTNFRNFVRLETAFKEGKTVLVGANAQGKTSLLEAIQYLTSARSPHTASDRQLIHFSALDDTAPFSRIVAELSRGLGNGVLSELPQAGNERSYRIEIRLILESLRNSGERRLRKEVLINGVKRRVGNLAGIFNAITFLPKDMQVIEGSPSLRRRFFDDLLIQADSGYSHALSEYSNVITQRNALLKRLQDYQGRDEQLAFWDDKLCEQAAILIQARARALQELSRLATPIHEELSRGVETLQLEYIPSYDPATGPDHQLDLPLHTPIDRSNIDLADIRTGMLQALQRKRREEIGRGSTTIGPHRDDFRFLVNERDLNLYGSRGQNRTAILATQFAEIEWLHNKTAEYPVLLLDEVMSELDPQRREDLLKWVDAARQAILTTADMAMLTPEFCSRATLWKISAGRIEAFTRE